MAPRPPTPPTLARPGVNCRRLARARRAAFLVDAEAYFGALAAAIKRARRSILIVGWDFDPHIFLGRDRDGAGADRLGDLLNRAADQREDLEVRVLVWDFSLFFAIEHRPFHLGEVHWRRHERVHLVHDRSHPAGASRHQKMVVIDDALAFVGGLDLTIWRWDGPSHLPDDPRRRDLGDRPYPPFHDVQMMVDGAAAAAVGELARERWRRAGGGEPASASGEGDPWPEGVGPDLTDVEVALAVTDPEGEGVREIEQLHLDVIASARRYIYLENQYLTAARLVEALLARLSEDEGPEIVIVTPLQARGWIVRHSLDYMRAKVVEELHRGDRQKRLRIFYPAQGPEREQIYVHAKVMIVDDEIVRIGSANLSNRSMSIDSECDLLVEAGGREDVRQSIRGLRDRLLGEHLGAPPGEVVRAIQESGSLILAIERLNHNDRGLDPIPDQLPPWAYGAIPDTSPFDPEMPLSLHSLFELLIAHQSGGESKDRP